MAVNKYCFNIVWQSHKLSIHHKPSEKDEAMRIKRTGGRIEPYKGN
jgi:hypothetical protein